MSFTGSGSNSPRPTSSFANGRASIARDMNGASGSASPAQATDRAFTAHIEVTLPLYRFQGYAQHPDAPIINVPQHFKNQSQNDNENQAPRSKETPVPVPQQSSAAAAAAAAKSSPTSTPRRGRPKGWRPGMSYSEMRGELPPHERPRRLNPKTAQSTGVAKRRGRPPKQPSPPPKELYHRQSAQFITFLCEWEGCKAELQNLDTLRRHVDYIHLDQDQDDEKVWFCSWAKCGRVDEQKGEALRRTFSTYEDLEQHVNKAHLESFAWHVGEGPSNRSGRNIKKAEDVPAYLFHKNGIQVTPSVRDQEIEDIVTWRNNRRKLKELLLERDKNLPSEESEGGGEQEGAEREP